MKTDFLSLKQKDAIKGAILTVITTVITLVYQGLATPTGVQWEEVGTVAASTFLGYLIKNFFTDGIKDANITLSKEGITRVMPPEEIKAHEQAKKIEEKTKIE